MMKKKYETAKIAIDLAIFTIHEDALKVLLHKREKAPFVGMSELPGGLLLADETAEQSLRRKLKELVGRENLFFKQFHTFTDPLRDLRERTVSIGFVSLISESKIKEIVRWHEYGEIGSLAFDHKKILETARRYLKENTDYSIVKQFMPSLFPLNKLQVVYEILEEKKYDNRNFRKKMVNSDIVEETDEYEQNVSHRPAKLFKFK